MPGHFLVHKRLGPRPPPPKHPLPLPRDHGALSRCPQPLASPPAKTALRPRAPDGPPQAPKWSSLPYGLQHFTPLTPPQSPPPRRARTPTPNPRGPACSPAPPRSPPLGSHPIDSPHLDPLPLPLPLLAAGPFPAAGRSPNLGPGPPAHDLPALSLPAARADASPHRARRGSTPPPPPAAHMFVGLPLEAVVGHLLTQPAAASAPLLSAAGRCSAGDCRALPLCCHQGPPPGGAAAAERRASGSTRLGSRAPSSVLSWLPEELGQVLQETLPEVPPGGPVGWRWPSLLRRLGRLLTAAARPADAAIRVLPPTPSHASVRSRDSLPQQSSPGTTPERDPGSSGGSARGLSPPTPRDAGRPFWRVASHGSASSLWRMEPPQSPGPDERDASRQSGGGPDGSAASTPRSLSPPPPGPGTPPGARAACPCAAVRALVHRRLLQVASLNTGFFATPVVGACLQRITGAAGAPEVSAELLRIVSVAQRELEAQNRFLGFEYREFLPPEAEGAEAPGHEAGPAEDSARVLGHLKEQHAHLGLLRRERSPLRCNVLCLLGLLGSVAQTGLAGLFLLDACLGNVLRRQVCPGADPPPLPPPSLGGASC